MTVYLLCPNGHPKEEWIPGSRPRSCPVCHFARAAEDEHGKPQILFAIEQNPQNWTVI